MDDQYIMLYKWRNDVCHLCCNGSGQSSKVNWSKHHPRSDHMMNKIKGHPLNNHVMWESQQFNRSFSQQSPDVRKVKMSSNWQSRDVGGVKRQKIKITSKWQSHDVEGVKGHAQHIICLLINNNINDVILRNIAQHYVILSMSQVLESLSLLWGEKSTVKCNKVKVQKIIHDVFTWPLPKC